MKIYLSKSSTEVKMITLGLILLIIFAIIALFSVNAKFGSIATGILVGRLVYFCTVSLDKILVDDKALRIKRTFGAVKITLSQITDIRNLKFSNLTMSYGSKGLFGYSGSTMDDCVSLVNDRKNMTRIVTNNKSYIISSEQPAELVNEVIKLKQSL